MNDTIMKMKKKGHNFDEIGAVLDLPKNIVGRQYYNLKYKGQK